MVQVGKSHLTKSESFMTNVNDIPYDLPGLWDEYALEMSRKGIESPRIVIHGNGGKNNMGDDAILEVLILRALKHFPKARLTIVCYGPEIVQKRYQHIDNLKACYFASWGTIKAIVLSNIYIIGGGGIINWTNAYAGFNKFRIFDMKGKFLYFAVLFAKLFGAKTNFYAIGATSFPDIINKTLVRTIVPLADHISVRDSLSLKNLRSVNIKREIHQILDPAFSLIPAQRAKALEILSGFGINNKDRPLIGLTLRYVLDGTSDNNETLDEAAKLVSFLTNEKGCTVFFIPTSQHPKKPIEDDLHFANEVKKRIGESPHYIIMNEYYDPAVMMAILGEMDFSILERLHAMILSSKMGVPMFAISYDNKIPEFAEIAKRNDIPSDPPKIIDVQTFNSGIIRQYIEPDIDKIIEKKKNENRTQ